MNLNLDGIPVGIDLPKDLFIFTFENVKNPQTILELIKQDKIPFTAINPLLVVSLLQIKIAVARSFLYKKTRGLSTEILLNLSPTNTIKDGLECGINNNLDFVYFVGLEKDLNLLVELVQGRLTDFKLKSDLDLIKKYYQISGSEDLEALVLTKMAVGSI
jgi:tRNA threonylcarbamoyladenosine modification (KEOPS) complex Cgi121 subunit